MTHYVVRVQDLFVKEYLNRFGIRHIEDYFKAPADAFAGLQVVSFPTQTVFGPFLSRHNEKAEPTYYLASKPICFTDPEVLAFYHEVLEEKGYMRFRSPIVGTQFEALHSLTAKTLTLRDHLSAVNNDIHTTMNSFSIKPFNFW